MKQQVISIILAAVIVIGFLWVSSIEHADLAVQCSQADTQAYGLDACRGL